MEKTINIPIEYKRLFDNDWREAAVYGGRYCFDGSTLISLLDGSFKRIDNIVVGDKVLSLGGDCDIVSSVDSFKSNFDPKPMFELEINGTITKTTYDHKYFNGRSYVPVYQLVWGIMDTSQRRTLELLCKQYGENTNNELQGWLQDPNNETCKKSQRVFNNGNRKKESNFTQSNSQNIYSEPREQEDCESQEWNKDRQSYRKLGMGNKTGAVTSSLENRAENRPSYTGQKLQEDNRERSERVATISLRQSKDADTNDGRIIKRQNWTELRWDTRFAEWKDLETSTSRLSSQETDSVGGKKGGIRVKKVYESVDVWSISTEKYHNYFANGVNVSNSLKSHTVARYLLIRARAAKTRVACFREFQSSIAESSYQLLSDLIKQYDLRDFKLTDNSIINVINGSDFLFKGLFNNEQTIKSIEGIDIAWVEEAQTVSKESLEVLTPTVRKDGSKIVYTYNRLLENDPVHQRLVIEGRPDTIVINVNYDIAEKYGWLPEVIKKEIEDDRLKRPVLYRQKWLGEPYISPNDLITESSLVKCLSNQPNTQQGRIIIGLDTAANLHYTMMNKEGVFYHGYVETPEENIVSGRYPKDTYDPYNEIERRLIEYPRSVLLSDQGGDLIGIRKLQAKYPGRVFLCWSNKETKSKSLIKWGEDEEYGKVSIDRNRVVQMAVDQIKEQRMTFNGTKEEWQPFFAHAMNVYRVKEIQGQDENDPQYGWRWVWKRKGPDHFFFSFIYALVGYDRFAEDLAQIVGKDAFMSGVQTGSNIDGTIQARRTGNYRVEF